MNFKKLIQEDGGLVLVVTLWILLILTLFALGMARSVNLDLLLSRYGIDSLKSYYLAKAAVTDAVSLIEVEGRNKKAKDFDSLYECGISLEVNQTPQDLFKDLEFGEGSFSVSYISPENKIIYGLEDEERRINLNAINARNYKVLINLMKLLGIDEEIAQTFASSVVDWRDRDSNVTNPPFGAEDSYYAALEPSYHCQNSNFQSLGELLLVRGMNKEVFLKIKNFITIFPLQADNLKVNINTAEESVLQALASSSLGYVPGTSQSDADSLVQKIIDYRKGNDNIIATADDNLVEQNKLGLNQNEIALFVYLNNNFFIKKSDYFRINATGTYKDKKVKSYIVVIVKRGEEAPLFWRED